MDVRFRCRNPECREPITRRNQIWSSEACRQDGAPAGGGDALVGRLGRWRETPDGTVWHFELPADLAGLGPCRQARSSAFRRKAAGLIARQACRLWWPCRQARSSASRWKIAGRRRWCRHRRARRNRWNRDRQQRPRPRHHPSAGPLRVRKHLQRSANATEPRSRPRAKGSLVSSRTLQHCRMVRPSGIRESQTKCVR